MIGSAVVGSVAGLWRFPVKSMLGEQLQEAEVTDQGVLGDRAYGLIEQDTGKVVSAKRVKQFPGLFACTAAFVEQPRRNAIMPAVQITFPDGTSVRSDSDNVDSVLSVYFKRNVRLTRVAPDDYTSEQHHPESFVDAFPVSVLTTSTLERLHALQPRSLFDERRFRMNVIVNTQQPGFIENDWVSHELALGNAARLNVAMPDPRCVVTTLAQGDLPHDTEVLRALVSHNTLQIGQWGQLPCAGVYAGVAVPGAVRTGDRVSLS